MKLKVFTFFYLLSVFCFAQHVEIVKQSGYKHNYALGRFAPIENYADTSKMKFIATLKIHEPKYPFIAVNFLDQFKRVGKELGANSYCLESYLEKDSAVTISIKTYFASENFFKQNEKLHDKEKIYFFSVERASDFDQCFYLKDSLIYFNSMNYYYYVPVIDKPIPISAKKILKTPRVVTQKAGHDSKFFMVGNNLPNAAGTILAIGIILGSGGMLLPYGKSYYKGNGIAKMDYEEGRFLLEIYKRDNN